MTSPSGREDRRSLFQLKEVQCLNDKLCVHWHTPLGVFNKKYKCRASNICSFVLKDDRSPSPEREQKKRRSKTQTQVPSKRKWEESLCAKPRFLQKWKNSQRRSEASPGKPRTKYQETPRKEGGSFPRVTKVASFQEAQGARNVTQKVKKNEKYRNPSELEDLSKDWTDSQEELARHTTWKLHKELYKIKGGYQYVKCKFFKGYSPVKEEADPSMSKPNIESKDRMYIVGSAASLQMVGLTSLASQVKTIRKDKERLGNTEPLKVLFVLQPKRQFT